MGALQQRRTARRAGGDRAVGPGGFRQHGRARIAGLKALVEGHPSRPRPYSVIDLSEGGLRIQGLELPVGSSVRFALEGGGVSCEGEGHVAHRGRGASGIAVDRWIGTSETVRSAVMSQLLTELAWTDAYISDWG
jgi:hypothetical protein